MERIDDNRRAYRDDFVRRMMEDMLKDDPHLFRSKASDKPPAR